MNIRQVRAAPVAGLVLIPWMLAGCGGGVVSDTGEAERLVCATPCKPSNTVATTDMRASFAVVGDGQQVQAQAGFSTGSDLRFNVEIAGNDSLQIATAQGTQGFHVPAGNLGTIIIDAFITLILGAKPYVSELSPSTGAGTAQFQFTRGSTVLSASVQMPAPFQITGPAAGATVSINARQVAVSLASTIIPANSHGATFKCTDVNGNTSSDSLPVSVVDGSVSSGGSGVSYLLNIGSAIDQLVFTTNFPRGAVASCDVTLGFTFQNQGQGDSRFSSNQVLAQQIRSVAFSMR